MELVYLPCHIPTPFRSLKRLESVPYVLLRGYGVNNIMFDSLTVYHLRICAFGIVDFYGTGTVDLLDNVRTFPFREKFSCMILLLVGKKSLYNIPKDLITIPQQNPLFLF